MTADRDHTNRYVGASEAAEILGGMHPKTVTRWAMEGKLAGVHIIRTLGGHRRYHRGDLIDLTRRHTIIPDKDGTP